MKYDDIDFLKSCIDNAEKLSNASKWSKEKIDDAKRYRTPYYAVCKMMTETDINHEECDIIPDDAVFSIIIPKLYFVNLVKYRYRSMDKFFVDCRLTNDNEFNTILMKEILSVVNENLDSIFENVKNIVFDRIKLMSDCKLKTMEKEIDTLKNINAKAKSNK